MKNITINNRKNEVTGETPIRLLNGNLVLHYDRFDNVIGAYIVTSFRDHRNKYCGADTTNYCSLVNLENGYIKFNERCSRNTNIKRVLSHLMGGEIASERALKEGQFIEVYPVGNYKIDISIERRSLR